VTCDDDQVAMSADGVEEVAVVGKGGEEALPGISAGWPAATELPSVSVKVWSDVIRAVRPSMSCRVMVSLNCTAIAAGSVL
jgi:hypothetical protein